MYRGKVWFFLQKHSNKIINGVILYYFIHNYVIDISYLEGSSMMPTFSDKGAIVLVDKFSFYFRKPKINEIISFINPFDKSVLLCKRVTGVEGDKRSMKNGKVVEVSKNNVWVEGDNKYNSLDSRIFGAIHKKLINGRIFLQIYPSLKWRFNVHV